MYAFHAVLVIRNISEEVCCVSALLTVATTARCCLLPGTMQALVRCGIKALTTLAYHRVQKPDDSFRFDLPIFRIVLMKQLLIIVWHFITQKSIVLSYEKAILYFPVCFQFLSYSIRLQVEVQNTDRSEIQFNNYSDEVFQNHMAISNDNFNYSVNSFDRK